MSATENAENFEKVVYLPVMDGTQVVGRPVKCSPSMVVIGANGSGKTRLGVWLEALGPQKDLVHRIPTQRMLQFPRKTSPTGMQEALDSFLWGQRPTNWNTETWESNKHNQKLTTRYGNVELSDIATAPVSDFSNLLSLLFSENYTQLLEFQKQYAATTERLPAPETILERVKRVWESILPHRTIEYRSSEVLARPSGSDGEPYLASGMSDGERVVFYLVGQCLCAIKNAIIVIDEPELHLHRSIQQKLWDKLEAERTDCQFIYITHDLAFAESRVDATKIWLKSSDGKSFDWTEIQANDALPESVYFELLGNRRPVIFVEGEYTSIDYDVYKAANPGCLIRPIGGCQAVLSATKAFRETGDFHHLKCFGAVDRDYLTDAQINAYQRANVFAPSVAEMENLFLLPDVLRVMANRLSAPSNAVDKVMEMVIGEFARVKHEHATDLTKRDIVLALGRFNGGKTVEEIKNAFAGDVASLNVQQIYETHLEETEKLISNRDYIGILKVFNRKDLANRATGLFGLTAPSYLERTRRALRQNGKDVIDAMRPYIPVFPLD